MHLRLLLLALLLVPLASAATVTIAEDDNYTIEDHTYTIHPLNQNATALEENGFETILKLKECLEFNYTRTCLTSVSSSSAVFAEEYTGAVLTATHTLSATTMDLGDTLEGTVTIKNTGKQPARDVLLHVRLPEGLELKNGDGQYYDWKGVVSDSVTLKYSFIGLVNSSYNITGNFSYINGSRRITKLLDRRTVSVTVPLTVTTQYDPNATRGSFNVTVKKKATENYTITLEMQLPPEMNVTSIVDDARQRGNSITYRSDENDSTATIYMLYALSEPASTELNLSVEYEREGEDRQQLNYSYPFAEQEDIEPSLAVSVDPLLAGQQGQMHVVVTGNRSGQLWLRGLLDYTTDTASGQYNFTVPAKEPGNYTLEVQFHSIDPYGHEDIAKGNVQLEVRAPAKEPEATPEVVPPPVQEQGQQEQPPAPTIQVETKSFPFLTLAIASVCLLVVLGFTLHRLRDPVTKLERLTQRVARLREEIQNRGEPASEEELVQLAALEEELDMLLKRLESQSSYKQPER